MAYTLVQTITVGSGGAASIEFTNIPQTGKDLLILLSGRNSGTSLAASVRPNSATTNLSARRLTGNGTTASSQTDTFIFAYISASTQTANTFGNTSIYISNYASASAKSFSLDGTNENSATDANQILIAGLWNQTTAISSLALVPLSSGTFEQYSTASLYIIDADGATGATGGQALPKATGGTISYSGGYWYHTFTSSGTFTPTQSLSCDVLCIAGGAGGGGNASGVVGFLGGGGGAGGLLYSAGLSVTSPQSVTVGSGGSGGASSGAIGSNGSSSSFGSLLSSSGGGGGGHRNNSGQSGGSGGGGGGNTTTSGGSGISGQGNDGGIGRTNAGGGGGGAGGVGESVPSFATEDPGNGGIGLNTYSTWASITGTGQSGYYAGGGGGSTDSQSYGNSQGGLGGGGFGGYRSTGGSGTANTGGGGGGSSGFNGAAAGGNGGSGIVIVRYAA